jgi:uncharacterized membrane protein YdbT with pleckstrin-like domain
LRLFAAKNLPDLTPAFAFTGTPLTGSMRPVNQETTLWQGSPSQWLNLGHFALAAVLAAAAIFGGVIFPPAWALLAIPVFYAGWRCLVVRSTRFELTTERLRLTHGVFNQKIDEIELYRVKDIAMERPLWMRLTGLSSILLQTSDRTMPSLVLPAIRNGVDLREKLRRQVEDIRDRKRVRELDMDHEGPLTE